MQLDDHLRSEDPNHFESGNEVLMILCKDLGGCGAFSQYLVPNIHICMYIYMHICIYILYISTILQVYQYHPVFLKPTLLIPFFAEKVA